MSDETETVDLDSMTKDELIAEAEARGIEVPSGALKADIRKLIDDYDGAGAEGGSWQPGDQAPFTPPIPPSGEGDMSGNPPNEPSVPLVELPSSVHESRIHQIVPAYAVVEDDS